MALLDAGADINAKRKKSGDSPMHAAVGNRRHDTLEVLMQRGADLEATNSRGLSPLALCDQLLEEEQGGEVTVPFRVKEFKRIRKMLDAG